MEGTSNERGKGKECYWVAEEQLMEMVMPQREVVPHEPSLSNMLFNVDPEWVSGTVVCIEAMPEILGPKVQSFLESNLNLKSQKSRVVLDGVNVVHGKGVVGCDVDGKNEKTSGGSVMEVGPAKCNGSGGEEIALRDVGGADVSTHRVEEAVDDCSYGDSVGDGSLEGDDGSSEGGVSSPVGGDQCETKKCDHLELHEEDSAFNKGMEEEAMAAGEGPLVRYDHSSTGGFTL